MPTGRFFTAAIGLALALGLASANAHEFAARDLRVEHPWVAPASVEDRSAAVYLIIENDGERPDRLVSVATTPGMARAASIEAPAESDMAKADPKARGHIVVPARGTATIDADDARIMLRELGVALTPGLRFPMFLTFASGAQLEIEVWVEDPATHAKHQHDDH